MTVNSPHSASLNRVSLYHKLRVPLAHFRKKSLFNSAKEAYQLGLITRVVTSTELATATEELALKLCQMSPPGIKTYTGSDVPDERYALQRRSGGGITGTLRRL